MKAKFAAIITGAILAAVVAMKNGPFCVGFAAESENLREYAQVKRKKKNPPKR